MGKRIDTSPFIDEWIEAIKKGESRESIARRYGLSAWTVRNHLKDHGFKMPLWKSENLGDIEAVWVAAMIDCEGTLTVHTPWNRKGNCRAVQVFCRVHMTNKEAVKRLHELCGGSFQSKKPRKKYYKPAWFWNLTANGLRWLLPQILPYLIVKKRHAEIMLIILDKNKRGAHNQMPFDELKDLLIELRDLQKGGFRGDIEKIRGELRRP